ncbi:MAG TPA: dihydroorotase [Patescibacteria group bacterium]
MKIKIAPPFDTHVHFRQKAMLTVVAPLSAVHFGRVIVEPNTTPVIGPVNVEAYKKRIESHAPGVDVLMTIYLQPTTTPADIQKAHELGIRIAKLYPEGVTTGSESGVSNISDLFDVFAEMEKLGWVLQLHGETPGIFCLDREANFAEHTLKMLVNHFPRLRLTMEHLSSKAAGEIVVSLPDTVVASVTVHHLLITLDDVIGDKINPHLFCKPVAKRSEDRDWLIATVMSGHSKLFLGTDSAPHLRERKECAEGCAGIFTGPVAMPLLAGLFDKYGELDQLEDFTSGRANRFYRQKKVEGQIDLVEIPWIVPQDYNGVVPFRAGQELNWQVRRI